MTSSGRTQVNCNLTEIDKITDEISFIFQKTAMIITSQVADQDRALMMTMTTMKVQVRHKLLNSIIKPLPTHNLILRSRFISR